jgi:hypothetical protein
VHPKSDSALFGFGAGRLTGQQETHWDDGATSTGNNPVVNFTQSIGAR